MDKLQLDTELKLAQEYISQYIARHQPITASDKVFFQGNNHGIIPRSHNGKWIGFEQFKKNNKGGYNV